MRKTSITLQGHRTSFSLEADFLLLLRALAEERALSLAQLVAQIDRARLSQAEPANLSSALRLFVLRAVAQRQVRLEEVVLQRGGDAQDPPMKPPMKPPLDHPSERPLAQALRQLAGQRDPSQAANQSHSHD